MTIVFWVAYIGLLLLLVEVVGRRRVRAMIAGLGHLRWEPVAPGASHPRLAPVVAALELEGYGVDSWAVLGIQRSPSTAVALVHPDGSMAVVRDDPGCFGRRIVRLSLDTPLIPGERSLGTAAWADVLAPPESLVEVAARRPDVAVTVARHRASRQWARAQGLTLVGVRAGEAGAVIEAGFRAVADRAHVGSILALRLRALAGGGRLRVPLARRADAARAAAVVRRRQEELALVAPR